MNPLPTPWKISGNTPEFALDVIGDLFNNVKS